MLLSLDLISWDNVAHQGQCQWFYTCYITARMWHSDMTFPFSQMCSHLMLLNCNKCFLWEINTGAYFRKWPNVSLWCNIKHLALRGCYDKINPVCLMQDCISCNNKKWKCLIHTWHLIHNIIIAYYRAAMNHLPVHHCS